MCVNVSGIERKKSAYRDKMFTIGCFKIAEEKVMFDVERGEASRINILRRRIPSSDNESVDAGVE